MALLMTAEKCPMLQNNKCIHETHLLRFGLLICVCIATFDIYQVDAIECGTVNLFRELILGGKEVLKGEWPFIAALYYAKEFKYFCGGTIISNKHVLTAAHCIQGKFSNLKLSPEEVKVRLGAYNLTVKSESGVVDRNVTQIYVHPDWNIYEEKYDADIAVLILSDSVTFSDHIRPICLPADDVNIEGVKGTVVGWGITENGTAEGIPRQTETNALNDSYCYRSDLGIARYSSERSFCGGGGDGSPNKGDSGGGYFGIFGSTWVQYGTVSVVRANGTGHIVMSSFSIYMSVKSFKNWIVDTVNQSGGAVSEATMKINLDCDYGFDSQFSYGCWLNDLDIRTENFEVVSVSGSNKFGKTEHDVELIVIVNGTMFFLPNGIGSVFQNLKYLVVGRSETPSLGTRLIRRSNLQNLGNLMQLSFLNNDIKLLDEDALFDLPNLQTFKLENSKVKTLDARTFSTNTKLRDVYIYSSPLMTLPKSLFQNNLLLEIVAFDDNSLETIDEIIFETNILLQRISFKRNLLEFLSRNLLRNNSMLEIIDFDSNVIKTIEEQTFETNSVLKIVSLESNKLEFLPKTLFQKNVLLETINFSNNSLKALDEELFQTNGRAREIYLRSNHLKILPSNLFRNNLLLEKIDLSKNFLEKINETSFESNLMLWKITIASNLLDDLPRNLFKNNLLLEMVNLRNNFMETIDEQFFVRNEKLKTVYLSGNYVELLPSKLFQNNVLLEIIDFGNNSLDTIDEQSFRTNTKLREVNLRSNLLEFLPTNLFRSNLLLEVVDLSKNFFKTIDENIFETSSKLRKVCLESNKLESLPKNLFRSNLFLEFIDFRDNSLKNIEIVFTELKSIFWINFYKNTCLDAVFYNVYDDHNKHHNKFENLTEFQGLITANCTSSNLVLLH